MIPIPIDSVYPLLVLMDLTAVFSLVIGFLLGKYCERKAWNELIQEGKIPKPKRGKV
jgi:hypothetical protein